MRRVLTVASACLVLALMGLAAGCGDDEDTSTSSTAASGTPSETTSDEANADNVAGAGHATVDVSEVTGNAFDPAQVSAAPADVIRFTNDDSIAHNAVADDGQFESPTMEPGGTYVYRVNEASGETITYVCTFHPGMEGTIEVK